MRMGTNVVGITVAVGGMVLAMRLPEGAREK